MISRAEVEHVARLARLALGEDELERMREQLNAILTHIDVLRSVDTTGVEPTSPAVRLVNVLRDDEPGACLRRDAALANAPDRVGDLFRVPRIIED